MKKKRHGHFCRICGKRKANEKFGGQKHVLHKGRPCLKHNEPSEREPRPLPPLSVDAFLASIKGMYLLDDSLYEYDPDALLTTDLGVLKTVEGLDFELDKEIEDDVELDSLLDPNEYSQILSDYKYLPDEDFDIAEFLENAEAHDAKASKKKNSKTKKK